MDRLVVLNTLKKHYTESVPKGITYNDLLNKLDKENKDMPVKLARALTDMGFRTVTAVNGMSFVMEQPEVTFQRVLYLQKIKKARSLNKNIYYIGVRTYKTSSSSPGDADNNMFFYYAMSRYEHKNGFFGFGNELSAENYLKWIIHVLIPLLEPSSVIVVNKSSFSEPKKNKKISKYDSKKEMISWLKRNDVPSNPLMHKAELYQLIEKCSIKPNDESIDSIFKAYGHEVLRLPDIYPELDPKRQLWEGIDQEMMKRFGKTNNFENDDFIPLQKFILQQRLGAIEENKWNEYEDSIIAVENEYLALDMDMEKALDKDEYLIANPQSICDE